MEEQKSKTVEMKPVTNSNPSINNGEQKKLSYDELNNIAGQLARENQYLKQQLQGATESLRMFNRLDYLLKVIEISNSRRQGKVTFTKDFIEKCIIEVQDAMKIPEEKGNDKDSKDA